MTTRTTTRTLRRKRAQPARSIRRAVDATIEAEPASPPEAVFDRATGPFDRRRPSRPDGHDAPDGDA